MRRFLVVAATVVAVSPLPAQVVPSRPSAMPVDPISGILDAFRTHAVVALGEGGHGNEQAHGFRLALLRDPRFARVVNDIVVERAALDTRPSWIGSLRATMCREMRAWRDTTQPSEIWDLPIYEELFRAVREVKL